MILHFGLSSGPFNTKFAPLAALGLHWGQDGTLAAFDTVLDERGTPDFPLATKLAQVLSSILAGCEYISDVNSRLRSETALARAWGWPRYLEQSSLARGLDQLSRLNLAQLDLARGLLWRQRSRARHPDWRGLLRLDLDLSGLPCGRRAEASTKGYFSGQKK